MNDSVDRTKILWTVSKLVCSGIIRIGATWLIWRPRFLVAFSLPLFKNTNFFFLTFHLWSSDRPHGADPYSLQTSVDQSNKHGTHGARTIPTHLLLVFARTVALERLFQQIMWHMTHTTQPLFLTHLLLVLHGLIAMSMHRVM